MEGCALTKMEFNYQLITERYPEYAQNDMLLHNSRIKEETKSEIRKYFKLTEK